MQLLVSADAGLDYRKYTHVMSSVHVDDARASRFDGYGAPGVTIG